MSNIVKDAANEVNEIGKELSNFKKLKPKVKLSFAILCSVQTHEICQILGQFIIHCLMFFVSMQGVLTRMEWKLLFFFCSSKCSKVNKKWHKKHLKIVKK